MNTASPYPVSGLQHAPVNQTKSPFHQAHSPTPRPQTPSDWARDQRLRENRGTPHPHDGARREATDCRPSPTRPHNVATDKPWDEMFALLEAYRAEHGHTEVPALFVCGRRLGRWVHHQRADGKSGKLRADRRARMDAIGFIWHVTGIELLNRWETRFGELLAFRERFGHCRIPRYWPENQTLSSWMQGLRVHKTNGTLSPERIRRLEAIGFEWHGSRMSGHSREGHWETMFAALQAYCEEHGHSDVRSDVPEVARLASWVRAQRVSRAEGRLRTDRRNRLEAIGFPWRTFLNRANAIWEQRLGKLLAFRESFGHCRVPVKWPEDGSLSQWVYRQHVDKGSGVLSPGRIQRLEAIGIEWRSDVGRKGVRSLSWEEMFAHLKAYRQQHGHISIPRNYREVPGLGRWIHRQRDSHSLGILSPDRREKLESLGISWRSARRSPAERWEQKFQKLLTYRERFGHCRVPRNGKDSEDLEGLGNWVRAQRHRQVTGRLRREYVERLNAVGIIWQDGTIPRETREAREARWQAMFAHLAEYHRQHGHTDVPADFRDVEGLASWVRQQRKHHADRRLRADRRERLETLGFGWRTPSDHPDIVAERRIAQLAAFRERFGHCRVPFGWPEDPGLAQWAYTQCRARKKGRLSAERIARLDEVGIDWNSSRIREHSQDAHWAARFAELEAYRRQHGHVRVPVVCPEAPALGRWARNQRSLATRGILRADRRERLEAIGLIWRGGSRPQPVAWEQRFAQLLAFRDRFGHARVPATWAEDPTLGTWVALQRVRKRKGSLNPDRVARLDDLSFDWDNLRTVLPEQRWDRRIAELFAFRERFGHCEVPTGWKENPVLGAWVSTQRVARKKGTLSPERIAQLEALGFTWENKVAASDERWERQFARLLAFCDRFGHCRVPRRWQEDRVLDHWVQNQRSVKKAGTLSPQRIARLDAVGFLWKIESHAFDERWEQRFKRLLAYRERFGHCRVPAKWQEDPAFGHWVHNQRSFKKAGTLSPERIARLDAIGFTWEG